MCRFKTLALESEAQMKAKLLRTTSLFFTVVFITTLLSAFAFDALADEPTLEQQIRAFPLLGTDIIPATEATLVKQGYGKAKDQNAFLVEWDGASYSANITYSNPDTKKEVEIIILGTKDPDVRINAVITSSDWM
jgi:hypothetical protein